MESGWLKNKANKETVKPFSLKTGAKSPGKRQ